MIGNLGNIKQLKQMKIKAILAIGALSAITAQVGATQINGSIDFSSIVGKEVKLFGANSFLLATGLDFPAGPNAAVDGASGAFAGELSLTATFNDINPFSSGINPVWTTTDGHFSFTLDAGYAIIRGAHFLTVDGTGTMHDLLTGLEDTAGGFTLTTQGSPASRRTSFSWSATDDATPTPDGGPTAILLGAGLLGLGAFASRKGLAI